MSGYIYHTVPVALHAWLSHPTDFRAAVLAAIQCGGDTDTVGAITGGMERRAYLHNVARYIDNCGGAWYYICTTEIFVRPEGRARIETTDCQSEE